MTRNVAWSLSALSMTRDALRGAEIHGIRVLGNCAQIPELADKLEIDLILIAIPSARSRQLRRIVEYCEVADTPFRALPCMQDLVAGRVSIDTLRELSIEDLLGRDPVTLDQVGNQRRTLREMCADQWRRRIDRY